MTVPRFGLPAHVLDNVADAFANPPHHREDPRLTHYVKSPDPAHPAEARLVAWREAFPWRGVPPEILAAVRGLPPGAVDHGAHPSALALYAEPGIQPDGFYVPPGFRAARIHDSIELEPYTYADACVDAARGRYMHVLRAYASVTHRPQQPLEYMCSELAQRRKAVENLTAWRFDVMGLTPRTAARGRTTWRRLPAEVRKATTEAVAYATRHPRYAGKVLARITRPAQVSKLQSLGVHVFVPDGSEELARERGEAWAGGLGSREIVGVARCVVYIASPSILAFDLAGTRGIAYAPTGHFWIRTEKKERLALRNAFERVRVSLSDVAEGRFAVCPW